MKKQLKLVAFTVAMLVAGMANAQQTSGDITKKTESTPGSGGTGSIRLIDNKGTIKYLQSSNGITMLTNTTNDVTTTTWQLGGTLSNTTYITAGGTSAEFALDGIALVTDTTTASTDAADRSNHGSGTTGFTVLIRDENTGAVQKIKLSDLLQVTASQTILENTTLPTVGTPTSITDLPADRSKVSVYRNGAKLLAGRDYNVTAGNITLVDRSSATLAPQDWTLYSTDIIEIHWVR